MIWPNEAFEYEAARPDESLRPFKCVLLMPFAQGRFQTLAKEIEQVVRRVTDAMLPTTHVGPTVVERLDWVTAAGVVQSQLWKRIADADLVFCDITGHNPNVMFEAGVCAARKRIEQVVFLRDGYYKPDQPFDIAPFRYIQYQMTSEGVPALHESLAPVVRDAVVAFPDRCNSELAPSISLPLDIDFSAGFDDQRLVTAPLAHRRTRAGMLEFGSLWSFAHSWATIGGDRFDHFDLTCDATFARLHAEPQRGYIGIGFRSHNPLVPFCHVVYLNRDLSVVLAQPDESVPTGYSDAVLREPTPIEPTDDHHFRIRVEGQTLAIEVDDCSRVIEIAGLPKWLSPGLIRFQSHMAWMGIRRLSLRLPNPDDQRV